MDTSKLDALIQEIAVKQRCLICNANAEVGHHFFSRRSKSTRWDLDNIIPLCNYHHNGVHSNLKHELEYVIIKKKGEQWHKDLARKHDMVVKNVNFEEIYNNLKEKL